MPGRPARFNPTSPGLSTRLSVLERSALSYRSPSRTQGQIAPHPTGVSPMQAPLLAAAVAAACLLSACGFVPPAPPLPPDTKRVAINHGDPRKSAAMQQTSTSRPESIPIALAPPPPDSGPTPTPGESGASATNATNTTNRAQPLPIPVPAAPSAAVAPQPTPAQPAPTDSATVYTPGQAVTACVAELEGPRYVAFVKAREIDSDTSSKAPRSSPATSTAATRPAGSITSWAAPPPPSSTARTTATSPA